MHALTEILQFLQQPVRLPEWRSLGRWLRDSERRESHKALRECEARLRALTELTADWYWEQDEQFRFVWQNGEAERPPHTRALRHIGLTRWEASPESLTPEQWAAHRAQLEAHETFHDFEYERRSVDGEMRWVSVSGSPIFDAAGGFRGYRGIGRDITERKQAESLRRLEHDVTRCIAEDGDVARTMRAVLRAVCEARAWECGISWRVDDASQLLRFAGAWSVAGAAIERCVEQARGLAFARGEGLAGLAWQSGAPAWSTDLARDRRVRHASAWPQAGVRGVTVFPLLADGSVVGVMAFGARTPGRPSERLLQAFGVIGSQIGQYLRRQAGEQALAASEQRFRSLTTLSSDWYWEQDAEYRFTFISEAFARTTRLNPADFLRRRSWDVPAPNLAPADWALHRAQLAGRETFRDFEVLRLHADGTPCWMSISGAPVFDAAGEFRGYRGVARDISARKRSQQMLDLEQAGTRALCEATIPSVGLCAALRAVCESERWDCGVFWRPEGAGERMRVAELCVVSDRAEVRDFARDARLQAYAPGEGLVGRVWRSGETLWIRDLGTDERATRGAVADRTRVRGALLLPVAVRGGLVGVLEFNAQRIRSPDRRLLQALTSIAGQMGQFVQRSDAEARLRESEQRFRSLTELSSDYYWEQDDQHRYVKILGAGPEGGLAPEGLLGKRPWEVNCPNMTPESWAQHRSEVEAQREFRDLVLARSGADESGLRYYSISGQPVFDGAGRFRGYRGVAKDVSDRLLAEEQVRRTNDSLEQSVRERTAELEHANRELESYNYSVSHDLRQPLGAIAGFAAMLVDQLDASSGPLALDCAREIEANARRMDQTIESLRRLGETGRATLRVTQVDVAAMVRSVVHDLAAAKPFRAEVVVGELPGVEADPVLLRQMWTNLVGNAIKYSRRQAAPRVEIGGGRANGAVHYTVRDNGIGFDMQDAARLFDAFERLPSAAAFEGHGIGLAIVQRIVQRHGGTIVAQAALGKGATFRLTLPERGLA